MHHRDTVCGHSEQNWQVSPYDGDVWCFACKPPRNLSEDYRRMMEIAYAAENTQADYGGVEIVTQCSDCTEIERQLDALDREWRINRHSIHSTEEAITRRLDALISELAQKLAGIEQRFYAIDCEQRIDRRFVRATLNTHEARIDDHERIKERITILEDALTLRMDEIERQCEELRGAHNKLARFTASDAARGLWADDAGVDR